MKQEKKRHAWFWLLGFFLVANLYLVPGHPHSPRAMDLLSLLLVLNLLAAILTRGLRPAPLATLLLLSAAPMVWGVLSWFNGLTDTLLLSLRWVMAVPWGYALVQAGESEDTRRAMIWGLWWGLVLNVAILLLQFVGLEGLTHRLGMAAGDSVRVSYALGFVRSPGLHGHANSSSAVASFILPVGLFLYYRRRAGIWMPLLSGVLLLVACHITSSRSPLIVGAICGLVITARSRRFWRAAILGLVALLILGPLVVHYGPPGGLIRWTDTAHMSANSVERLQTHGCALNVCMDDPLGVGVEEARTRLETSVGLRSSHNAFLQVGMTFGLFLSLLLLVLIVRLAWLSLRGAQYLLGLEAICALQLFGLFFFEEHLNNPTFLAMTAWLATTSATGIGMSSSPAPGESELK